MIKLVLIDDDALIRESLAILLEGRESIHIVGIGRDGRDALALAEQADVMLLDLRMPVLSGLDVLADVAAKTKVLVLTTFDEDEAIVRAFHLGASGYLLKSATPQSIVQAIVAIAGGQSVFDEVAREIVRQNLKVPPGKIRADLSEREIDVVRALAEGLSNREIAERLFLSEGTIKNHISAILLKTGLEHRTQIAIGYLQGKI